MLPNFIPNSVAFSAFAESSLNQSCAFLSLYGALRRIFGLCLAHLHIYHVFLDSIAWAWAECIFDQDVSSALRLYRKTLIPVGFISVFSLEFHRCKAFILACLIKIVLMVSFCSGREQTRASEQYCFDNGR